MQQLQALRLGNQFHGEVRAGECAGGAKTELTRVGLGPAHIVRPGLERRVRRHHQAEGIAGDVQDVADVLDWVPINFGGVGQAKHAQRDLRQGVAIGRRGLQRLRGQGAARAGLVFNNHRLAQNFGGAIGQRAHGDVRWSASGERNDEPDRLGRKALGLGGQNRGDQGGASELDELTTFHGWTPD